MMQEALVDNAEPFFGQGLISITDPNFQGIGKWALGGAQLGEEGMITRVPPAFPPRCSNQV
jgi:hypothetical protein